MKVDNRQAVKPRKVKTLAKVTFYYRPLGALLTSSANAHSDPVKLTSQQISSALKVSRLDRFGDQRKSSI